MAATQHEAIVPDSIAGSTLCHCMSTICVDCRHILKVTTVTAVIAYLLTESKGEKRIGRRLRK